MGIHIMPVLYQKVIKLQEIIVYPDAHPETTSVDGMVQHIGGSWTWLQLCALIGTIADDDGEWGECSIGADGIEDRWNFISRTFLLFDTSSIPLWATVISAILTLSCEQDGDGLSCKPAINIFTSNPATNASLALADLPTLGETPLSVALGYDDITGIERHDFILNAAGRTAINKGGITKLGSRESKYDAANVEPPWVQDRGSGIRVYTVEKGTGYKPTLTIRYLG